MKVFVGMMADFGGALHGWPNSMSMKRDWLNRMQRKRRSMTERFESGGLYPLGAGKSRSVGSYVGGQRTEHGRIMVLGGGKHDGRFRHK